MYKEYAMPMNNFSTGVNIVLNYGEIPFKIANDNFNRDDIKKLYINAMGDVGAYIGGFAGGSLVTTTFIESGPAAFAAGTWGAVVGAQIGRKVFGAIGGYFYDILFVIDINKQLEQIQNYHRIHYPINNYIPY